MPGVHEHNTISQACSSAACGVTASSAQPHGMHRSAHMHCAWMKRHGNAHNRSKQKHHATLTALQHVTGHCVPITPLAPPARVAWLNNSDSITNTAAAVQNGLFATTTAALYTIHVPHLLQSPLPTPLWPRLLEAATANTTQGRPTHGAAPSTVRRKNAPAPPAQGRPQQGTAPLP